MIRRAAVAVVVAALVVGCSASVGGNPERAQQRSGAQSGVVTSTAEGSAGPSPASVATHSETPSTEKTTPAGTSTSGRTTSSAATSGTDALVGSYTMVGDVDGATVNSGATITLTLSSDGTLTFHAVQPGQTVDDTGT